jgi:hypothetical protein
LSHSEHLLRKGGFRLSQAGYESLLVHDALSLAGFRVCYLIAVVTGAAAARLADDFRVLGAACERVGPWPVVLQIPVLACWVLMRPISIAAFAGCLTLAPRVR